MIEKYKDLLDIGTFESMGFTDDKLSRYESFNFCLKILSNKNEPKILELGTCRSFVDGKYEGCNSDDIKYWEKDNYQKWDWGAGCFSLVFGQSLPNAKLTTVDLIQSHINRCKLMTDSLNLKCNHFVSNSVKFLSETKEKYDLIYLDTGDMTPIEPTAILQLEEVKIITSKDILSNDGLILIDDVLNKTPKQNGDNSGLGKSKYSIPYLLDEGYKIVFNGYQVALQK